ncbi:MAG: acyl-CoA dehydrogenase [Gemmatimonadetes bacterium]|nr:acyl-CoA dehydrogenase [Gemmatimonadota bacterium]
MLELTEDQKQLQEAAIAFAQGKLGKDMIERDRDETFDRAGWNACAEFGVMGMPVPAEYGGLGLGLTELIAVMEGLGYGSKDSGLLFSINAHLWTVIVPTLQYGTEEQKKKYIPKLVNGEMIGANAATEPDSGSDVFAMRTHAVKDGDDYVISGSKMFVTNAPVADVFALYATVVRALGATGVTGFLIDRDTPGVDVPRPLDKMGLRTSPMAEVVLDECRVGPEARLGKEGRGAAVFDCSMEWERGCILASFLGAMRRMLEESVKYAREREQFGMKIGKFQSVANRIVDMKVRLEAARPLVYRIGQLKDAGKDARQEAAVAKLFLSEAFIQSGLDAMRTFGSYGYMTEQELERDMRDGLGGIFYSGTSDIQRNIIARGLGL